MTLKTETRRTGMCGRASDVMLGGSTSDMPQTPLIFNQAARIARQFVVSDAVARAIAEHAFAARPAR